MHQTVQRLGLRPSSYWGAHSAPQTPVGKGEGTEGKGRGGKGREQEGGEKGSEGRLPPLKFKSGYTPLVCV